MAAMRFNLATTSLGRTSRVSLSTTGSAAREPTWLFHRRRTAVASTSPTFSSSPSSRAPLEHAKRYYEHENARYLERKDGDDDNDNDNEEKEEEEEEEEEEECDYNSYSSSYADETRDFLERKRRMSPVMGALDWLRCLTACKPVHGDVDSRLVKVKYAEHGTGVFAAKDIPVRPRQIPAPPSPLPPPNANGRVRKKPTRGSCIFF